MLHNRTHEDGRLACGQVWEAGLAKPRTGAGTLYDANVVTACEEVVARGMADLRQN